MFYIILNLNLHLHQNQEGLFSQGLAVAQNSCIAQGMTMLERQENPGAPCATMWFVMQKPLENLVVFFSFCSEMYNFLATLFQSSLGFIFHFYIHF